MSSLKEIKQSVRLHVTSGKGFSLVIAILAILILTALGYLVVMMSTQDTRASSRVVGEKKAMAAAETGIHQLMVNFNPDLLPSWSSQTFVSGATSDATSQYTLGTPSYSGNIDHLPGFAAARLILFDTEVTGVSNKYNANVNVQVQTGYFSPDGGGHSPGGGGFK